jgi:hypothetical protein
MARYTLWKDVVNRYPSFAKMANAEEVRVEEVFIYAAEAEIDARCAALYTVPFCTTPTLAPYLVKDIATDLTYYRASMLTLSGEQGKILWDSIERRLSALATGSMTLITSAGVQQVSATAWSTAQFPNVSGMDEVASWAVSADELAAQEDKRDD